jgi:hypothetical protein
VRGEQQLRDLADTQAALQRLAALAARREPPEAVFAGRNQGRSPAFRQRHRQEIRYQLNGTATLVASEGTTSAHVRVGECREGYPPAGLTATVLRTGQAARVNDYRDIPGGEPYLREGLRSAVATPVHVNGWRMFPLCRGRFPGRLPLTPGDPTPRKYAPERQPILVTALGRDFEITNELAGIRIIMRTGNALYSA